MPPTLAVVIPTRNRPDKLAGSLAALERAREFIDFPVYVCDSSPELAVQAEVEHVCNKFPFVNLRFHKGTNVAAARNFCATTAAEDLLCNVDDDVNVEPEAIFNIYQKYLATTGWRVVGGSVFWGEYWNGAVVKRRIGYGRLANPGEDPSFLIGAFFLYPRALALSHPWNERLRTSDDTFMGALWRSKNVALIHEASAKANHNTDGHDYGYEHQESHIYTNLFDTLIANRDLPRAAAYEFLGFAAGAKQYFRDWQSASGYVKAWYRGHKHLIRDWDYLNKLISTPLPKSRE